MEEINIVDNYMDDREFRNYVHTMFYKNGFKYFRLDDARVSDEYPENDNDIKVTRDGKRYDNVKWVNHFEPSDRPSHYKVVNSKNKYTHGIDLSSVLVGNRSIVIK